MDETTKMARATPHSRNFPGDSSLVGATRQADIREPYRNPGIFLDLASLLNLLRWQECPGPDVIAGPGGRQCTRTAYNSERRHFPLCLKRPT